MPKEVKMVKVRVLKQFGGNGFSYGVGAEVQLPSKEVTPLVKAGLVERADYDDTDFKRVSAELDKANKALAKAEAEIAALKIEIEKYSEVAAIADTLASLAKK